MSGRVQDAYRAQLQGAIEAFDTVASAINTQIATGQLNVRSPQFEAANAMIQSISRELDRIDVDQTLLSNDHVANANLIYRVQQANKEIDQLKAAIGAKQRVLEFDDETRRKNIKIIQSMKTLVSSFAIATGAILLLLLINNNRRVSAGIL